MGVDLIKYCEGCQNPKIEAARVITGDNYDIRSSDIFNKLGQNNLQDRQNSQTMNFVIKALFKKCPEAINEMFHVISNDNYNLRSNDLVLGLSKPNTNTMKISFSHAVSKFWNSQNKTKRAEVINSVRNCS